MIRPAAAVLAAFALLHAASAQSAFCPTATYKLTVTHDFGAPTFPDAPETAILSPLTAFSHSTRYSAFVLYGYATPGVQLVAETGDNSVLQTELADPDAAPFIKTVVAASSPAAFGESFTAELQVDCNMSRISFISMIAPSPDWIVAIANMNMLQDGVFVREREGNLFVYDAGTDSGETLMADDIATEPRENIAPFVGAPFNGMPAASYKLELVQPECPVASYELSITSLWTEPMFSDIPDGAMLSPLSAASHSRRFSALVRYGYATPGVQLVAETGNNSLLLEELRGEDAAPFVKTIDAADGPALGGETFSVRLDVDCNNTFISAVSMVAPSPDWIIAIANMNTFVDGYFVNERAGMLKVYDAGTDSGMTLLAEDVPTIPRENIAPLLGPPFRQRPIAEYMLQRVA